MLYLNCIIIFNYLICEGNMKSSILKELFDLEEFKEVNDMNIERRRAFIISTLYFGIVSLLLYLICCTKNTSFPALEKAHISYIIYL